MSSLAPTPTVDRVPARIPSAGRRILSIWYRHYRTYRQHLISNGTPPFIEPLFFLAGIGLGLGRYVGFIDDVPFVAFLAAGITVPPAMFTAAFECTFGTFIRLEIDKVYDGMISSSITVRDLFVGEMLFAATKGLFFATAVALVMAIFGLTTWTGMLASPVVGFITGGMFAAASLFVTSFVNNINHFNFYFTGFLTPQFFFSGIIFPLSELPPAVRVVAHVFPLTHMIRLIRGAWFAELDWGHLGDLGYAVAFSLLIGAWALRRLRQRLLK